MPMPSTFFEKENWWEQDAKTAHETAFQVFDALIKDDQIGQMNWRHSRLYGHRMLWGLTAGSFDATAQARMLKLNVIQSMVDTLTNQIGREKIRTVFMTNGSDFQMRRQARQASKFGLGVFQQNDGFKQVRLTLRDACIFGYGAIKTWREKDKICLARTFPDELRWEPTDALYGKPRVLWQFRTESRAHWLGMFSHKPKLKKMIMDAPSPQEGFFTNKGSRKTSLADRIEVLEGWRLPSSTDAKDGKHILCLRSGTLALDGWDKDYHPFAFMHISDPVQDLRGRGLAELLTGVQVAINQHLDMIEKAFGWVGVPRIFVDDMSEVSVSQMNNMIGSIVTYAHGSAPPTVSAPSVIPPELLGYLQFLLDWAYRIAGIAEMQATGSTNDKLVSGRAIRESADQGAIRHALVQANFEDMHTCLYEQIFDHAKDMQKAGEVPKTSMFRGRHALEEVDFTSIDLEKDAFKIQAFPSSLLPQTPAGRYATVQEWIADGTVSREEGMALIDMPDLDASSELLTAAQDDIDDLIDRFLFGEPDEKSTASDEEDRELEDADALYIAPDPLQNLALGARRMNSAYLRARIQGVPEARRELLARWIADAESIMAPPEQPMAPAPAGPEGAPPAPVPA